MIDICVLIEFVGLIQVRDLVGACQLAVADGVVGIGVGVGTHSCTDKFGANIVGKGVRGQGRIGGVKALGAAGEFVVGVGECGDDVGAEGVGDKGWAAVHGA